ncbi:DNA-directed RNA polymerase III subunit C1 (rpo31) [Conglomerata obtusa]
MQIQEIHFSVLTPNQLESMSTADITKKEIYDINTKFPTAQGPLDPCLGSLRGTDTCQICNQTLLCPGHFGSIKLHLPVFHVGFFKQTYNILQCICKTCACLLLPNTKLAVKKSQKSLIEESRRITKCYECCGNNSPIKRGPGFKLFHGESKQELSPLFVLNLFKMVRECDYSTLGISFNPINLLVQDLPVPPSCIRPSVKMLASSNEDDLTVKLCEIIHTNDVLKTGIEKGNPLSVIQEDWDFLQLQVSLFINSDLPNFNKADSNYTSTRPIRGLIQRLKGKGGRFRGNLSGKRVDFSGRTVISPDPYLSIEELGLPLEIAKTLTIPDVVTKFNKKELSKNIKNGPLIYPGANYHQNTRGKSFLMYANKEKIIDNLKEGDVVERHIKCGDIVLFNRQPSLHRISIMAHKVKIHPYKTLRFNECVCTPYNADFDGDEMNIHVPQTIEARVEAYELMRVGANLVTPRNGEPLVAATQDFITAMYILTGKNIFFTKEEFGQTVGSFVNDFSTIDTIPCIKRPCLLYSGKQVFELLIKDAIRNFLREYKKNTKNENIILNFYPLELRSKNRSYKDSNCFLTEDTLVIFKNNNYICGQIDKSLIGTENKKGSLIYKLILIGSKCAINAMNSIAKLSSYFLSNHGFSIGLNDVKPTINLLKNKEKLVNKIYKECDDKIREYGGGKLQSLPGCSTLETLESSLSSLLSKIRDECGNFCINELGSMNSPIIMQACGSKGSKINVSQMVACVGQQIISGKRISDAFTCNSLIKKDSKNINQIRENSNKSSNKAFCNETNQMNEEETSIKSNEELSKNVPMIDNKKLDMKSFENLFYNLNDKQDDINSKQDYNKKTSIINFVNKNLLETKNVKNNENLYNNDSQNKIFSSILEINSTKRTDLVSTSNYVTNTRTLPHYDPTNSLSPLAKGFVCNSFYSGLQPSEFFFHAVSGREGLVDTAVKTAETGYMQRRLMKAMEDLKIAYDLTVRNAVGDIIQFSYEKDDDTSVLKISEPGTAVGAIAGQSIGEPGTQMTLKTFHFAGVASMNITLGVPRLKEIINATKNILTPIIKAEIKTKSELEVHKKQFSILEHAYYIKGRIDKTYLKDICSFITEVYGTKETYFEINIDFNAVSDLKLELNMEDLKLALSKENKIPLDHIISKNNIIEVYVKKDYYTFKSLKRKILETVVYGIKSVSRCVVNEEKTGSYNLIVEGTGLCDVLGTEGIRTAVTNNILEILDVLGVEAAREAIIKEVLFTMEGHGITIDKKHVDLLADTMTAKGVVLGITRFGISKMKMSTLMLASFEQTSDHLFDAALKGKKDAVKGVSESIIVGKRIEIGTGVVDLYYQQ